MRGHRAIAGGRADVRKLLFMAAVTAIRHGTRRAVVAKAETRWSGPSSRRRSWLRQEAVPDKANELAAIPPLLERLGAEDGLKGALVSIDANATNPAVAEAITAQGAGWLLAVKANQPTLRAEVEAAFAEAGDGLDACATRPRRAAPHDRGPSGRLARGRASLSRRALPAGDRLPAQDRDPGRACRRHRTETRYLISPRALGAADAAEAAREHWAIENRLRLGWCVTRVGSPQ